MSHNTTSDIPVVDTTLLNEYLDKLSMQNMSDINDLMNISFSTDTTAPSTGVLTVKSSPNYTNTYNTTYANTINNGWSGLMGLEDEIDKRIAQALKKELKPVLARLAILEEPDSRVLAQFEALKNAYEQYRLLESLMLSEIEKITKT